MGCKNTQEFGEEGRKCWAEIVGADKNGEYKGYEGSEAVEDW